MVFGEVGWDDFVGVVDVAGGGEFYGAGHGDDFVGGWDLPAGGPLFWWWGVGGISCGGVCGAQAARVAISFSGEGRIVGEMADGLVGEPGRHFAIASCGGDGLCVGASMFVGEEWHGGDFVGAVAGLAAELKDGQDVTVEGGSCGRVLCAGETETWRDGEEKQRGYQGFAHGSILVARAGNEKSLGH